MLHRGAGVQKHGINFGCQMAVHASHLCFVVVIGDRAQASHNDTRALGVHKVTQQTGQRQDTHIAQILRHFLGHGQTLVQCEQRFFMMCGGHGHHHFVKHLRRSIDHVFMTQCQWVKGSRINSGN